MNSNTFAPGIYADIPPATYHAIEAVSSSILKRMHTTSPLHAQHLAAEGMADSKALTFGDSCHAALLEPDRFDAEYVVAGQCNANKKDSTRCSNQGTRQFARETCGEHEPALDPWFCGVHAKSADAELEITPERLVSREERDRLIRIRRRLWSDNATRPALEQATRVELTVIWQDEATGLLCKARPDLLIEQDVRVMYDLKTTSAATLREFERKAGGLAYHLQLAMYADGLAANGIDIDHAGIIAVESAAPHDVVRWVATDDYMSEGYAAFRAAIELYADCSNAGTWPGVAAGTPKALNLPPYLRNQNTEL